MVAVTDRVIDIVAEQLGVDRDKVSPETSFVNDLNASEPFLVRLGKKSKNLNRALAPLNRRLYRTQNLSPHERRIAAAEACQILGPKAEAAIPAMIDILRNSGLDRYSYYESGPIARALESIDL